MPSTKRVKPRRSRQLAVRVLPQYFYPRETVFDLTGSAEVTARIKHHGQMVNLMKGVQKAQAVKTGSNNGSR